MVSNRLQIDLLVSNSFNLATKKTSNYWPFVKGIHRWPVGPFHKGTVIQKVTHNMTSSSPLCFLVAGEYAMAEMDSGVIDNDIDVTGDSK